MAHLEHRDFFLFNDISGMSIENELLEDGFPLDFFPLVRRTSSLLCRLASNLHFEGAMLQICDKVPICVSVKKM